MQRNVAVGKSRRIEVDDKSTTDEPDSPIDLIPAEFVQHFIRSDENGQDQE